MNRRELLKKSLATLVLALSPYKPALTQEPREKQREEEHQVITVNRKKYFIYPNRAHNQIQDKDNKTPGQNILRDVMKTYLISHTFKDYQKTAEKNLKNFQKARTRTQIAELLKAYSKILKAPLETIIGNLTKENPGSSLLTKALLTKINLIKGTYKKFKQTLLELHLDERMYTFADITEHSQEAEPKYKEFISLLEQGLTDYERAKEAFELCMESEYIIKSVPEAYKELTKEKQRINSREQEIFYQALEKSDIETLQDICRKIQSRARKSDEYDDYQENLKKHKTKSRPFKLKYKIREQGLLKAFQSSL